MTATPAQITPANTLVSRLRTLLRRWPAAVGLGFGAFLVLDGSANVGLAYVLAVAAVIYLAAAAFGKAAAAWPAFLAGILVITVADFAGLGVAATTWILLGLGVPVAAYGLLRGAGRPAAGLPLQAAAVLGFGAVALVALVASPVVGSYVVAFGLLGHAAWDLHHHRTNTVVARSYAEFCLVLDTALAATILAATLTA
ncbi:hypothetical protein [Flindersiella endophytica]